MQYTVVRALMLTSAICECAQFIVRITSLYKSFRCRSTLWLSAC